MGKKNKVQKAIELLEKEGYKTDLLFEKWDAEQAIKMVAEDLNIDVVKMPELVNKILSMVKWEVYSQQINDDLQTFAYQLLKGMEDGNE